MATVSKVLILGGTGEAVALAQALDAAFGPALAVVTSLAGRTKAPTRPLGDIRVGGFGGVPGLTQYLRDGGIDAVIDATHPFAARITANAVAACAATGVPRLRLDRPAWTPAPGDDWRLVPDLHAAAALLPALGGRAFLTVGSSDLGPFKEVPDVRLWARMIEPPAPEDLPKACTVIQGRGPFSLADEEAFLRENRIDILVTKNSGGAAAAAKLTAARGLGLPVVMVDRPPSPPGDSVPTAEDAVEWLRPLVP
ncbi:cobalt-precorrin-6A reductase [Hwanghaeella grinnelliae]|uniref:Cobalt-precorrin-6A reductase n=1 Tax=Hwanghaeella grinnelliae TaxID=2500179 RepID=A0A437QNN2_9PROT|nr:cobalt-precorrin-6A reductase [Hwanghaeella grinnelliae]RVU36094.1 cobalt-precorrin-6A reductase [Hwanghaeella grinnelliae]